MNWNFLYPYESVDTDIQGIVYQTTGAPVLYSTRISECPAGLYVVQFSTATSVTIYELAGANKPESTLNPWIQWVIDNGPFTVVVDGVTANYNILPGWSFVFGQWTQAGDEFVVAVGCLRDGRNYVRALSYSQRIPGNYDSPRTFKVQNNSGLTLTGCSLVATNAIILVNGDTGENRPFASFYQTGLMNPTPDSDSTGATITFDNYAAGSPPTVDILITGETVSILDVAADSIIPEGVGLQCDGATVYSFVEGDKYQSGTFTLSANLAESDTAQIYVTPGGDNVELASLTGDFASGPVTLVLTQAGQAAGTVLNAAEVSFRLRINPAADTSSDLGLHVFSLRAIGTNTSVEYCAAIQGNFRIADISLSDALDWKVQALRGQYELPRYTQTDPGPPAVYVEDHPDGLYIEDPANPGSYILASTGPNAGFYDTISALMADNGVTVVSE